MLISFAVSYLCIDFYIFNMNYLAQMLRDCSKNRSSSFTQISFPIIQEIQNKIKNKNFNLRKKMRQRLIDRQRISKIDEKKDDGSGLSKKDGSNGKTEKEIINYIEAYDDQKNYQTKTSLVQLQDVRLDDKETENTFLIYILMRKRKSIFKIEEIRRKMRNKENMKRMSLKECDCCERIGKHRCLHTFCEGRCEKLRKSDKYDSVAAEDFYQEEFEAVEVAQEMIEEKVKMEDLSLNVVRIIQKQEEAISIPKIDITEKEDQLKEQHQEEILNERDRISENESKSEISESRRNRSSEQSKVKENLQQQKDVKMVEQPRVEQTEKQADEEMQQEIEDDLVQIQTIQRVPIRKDNNPQEAYNKSANEKKRINLFVQQLIFELIQASNQPVTIAEKTEIHVNEPNGSVQKTPEIQIDQQDHMEQNGNFLDVLLTQLKDNFNSDKPDPEMRSQ